MRLLLILVAALILLALAGCSTPEQREAEIEYYCQGVFLFEDTQNDPRPIGHPNYNNIDCDPFYDDYIK